MSEHSVDSLKCLRTLNVDGREYEYFSLPDAAGEALHGLPFTLRILLENLLRNEDGRSVRTEDIHALVDWAGNRGAAREIAYHPARVLMQDFTGVPAICDLAAMRGAVARQGKDPAIINPLSSVDLVIDHSVMVDDYGSPEAFERNVGIEMQRNAERYRFLRWGQQAFRNFRVVPPGTGICHQVNLEYLARVVWSTEQDGRTLAYPDTLVGTDSHTTMINGLGVLGWGVGGIEAEAAMLGQPVSMLVPEVVGFRLEGVLGEGITATDLVLRVVQMLRERGVVGKFVEFFGTGLAHLSLADRATIANMAPEYGATCGFFPIDRETVRYLELTGRDPGLVSLVEAYAKAQGQWWTGDAPEPVYSDNLVLDLARVEPSLAGPRRPQDRVSMAGLEQAFVETLELQGKTTAAPPSGTGRATTASDPCLRHGDVVIAAITSCTNTSNPAVMLGAGLLARNALARGLKVKPWVKTSLAPGSKVVTEYLRKTGLQESLDALGFNLVGYGCTTCIGNSGPLPESISAAIHDGDLIVCSVLSGNRNFEGRVHQEVRANWLASPPLVVAYALAGTVRINLEEDPIAINADGQETFLRDIWPKTADIQKEIARVSVDMFRSQYADVFAGTDAWRAIEVPVAQTYAWPNSTYIKEPPFFREQPEEQSVQIRGARILAVLGDSVTTDHISPAGAIAEQGPAGRYLQSYQIGPQEFNSFGSRRGNHEVMMRGTFANIRIRNEMVSGVEGGYTIHPANEGHLPIYDAAMRYREEGTPLVVIAGKEYGTGSSRDWAAKGTMLLGVRAVIVESFERIHRANLVGMGVMPLQFTDGQDRRTLELDGSEVIDIELPDCGDGEAEQLRPGQYLRVRIRRIDGSMQEIRVLSRLDTVNEIEYFKSGGILQYVLNRLLDEAA